VRKFAAFDDLKHAEDGQMIVADETVTFGIDEGEWELDLTAENADELRLFLKRYQAAGRQKKAGPQRRHRIAHPGSLKAARQYGIAMREWADARSEEFGPESYTTDNGNYYPKKQLRDAYTKYLEEQATR
jgi:hypothetical protein